MTTSISQTPIDPIQILPDEILNECLSLLPPFSIAHSSAINKAWRQFIHSHSNLHNEADLSHLGFAYYKRWRDKHGGSDESDLESFLDTFHHISITPTPNHLTKLSINLSILWEEYVVWIYEGNVAMESFAATMCASGKNLKEISFLLDPYDDDEEDPLSFLKLLIQELKHFSPNYFYSLKSIWIRAPVYFSIKAGGDDSSSKKSFTLVPTMPMFQGCWDDPEINMIKMMSLATNFVGEQGGLTDFRVQPEYRTEFGSHSMNEIVQVLKTSTTTLRNLYLSPAMEGQSSLDSWELASSCPRLVSFFSYYDDYEHERNLPDRMNQDSLKDLGLIRSLNYTDCSTIRKWIGGHLEKFNLIAQTSGSDLQLCSPCSPISIILDSRESLKVLELEIDPFLASNDELQVPLSFPNLESLSLQVEGEIGQWFSKLDLPKLHTLCLKTRNFQQFNSKNDTGFFYSLLDNHSSKLTNLAFQDSLRTEHTFILAEVPKLSFIKLTHLDLGQCSESHKSWFSRFLYPNLISFSKSKDSSPFWPKVSEDETMGNQVQWEKKDDTNLWERCKRT